MNCRTCQFELSQCLDGRLPSGRRAAVMQHAADCEACAEFWTELQTAQQLVLRLSKQRVGSSFRDALWERIQSGEGTPSAVFQEPVPLAAKARYLLTGAAAAALMLVALRFATSPTEPATTDVAIEVQDPSGPRRDVARVSAPGPAPAPENESLSYMNAVQPLTPNLMAQEAAVRWQDRLASASLAAERLRTRGASESRSIDRQVAEFERAVRELREQAIELRLMGSVILQLEDDGYVYFSDESIGRELRIVIDQIDEVVRGRDNPDGAVGTLSVVLSRASDLGRLPQRMLVRPSYSRDQLQDFATKWLHESDVFRCLFVCLPSGGGTLQFQLDPQEHGNVFFAQQGECAPGLVVPRSRMHRLDVHFKATRK